MQPEKSVKPVKNVEKHQKAPGFAYVIVIETPYDQENP